MSITNLQGEVYFINHHKRVGRTSNYEYVALNQVHKLYHQCAMEGAHKYPNVVPTVDPKECPNTLEMVVEYIRGFHGVDGNPLSYCLRDDLAPRSELTDPTVGTNKSTYLTSDEEMIARGKIISGVIVAGTYPEVFGPFADSYVAN